MAGVESLRTIVRTLCRPLIALTLRQWRNLHSEIMHGRRSTDAKSARHWYAREGTRASVRGGIGGVITALTVSTYGFKRLATRDTLTGLSSRFAFDAHGSDALQRAARKAEQVSLLILDLDHFRSINSAYGHEQGGDEALKAVASAWQQVQRNLSRRRAVLHNAKMAPRVGRRGGEEFAILLPGIGPDEAFGVAERFRIATQSAWPVQRITVSIGLATYPVHAADYDQLVKAADRAMYHSKDSGRDRTTTATA